MKTKVLKKYRVYENIITCLDKHLPAWQHVKEMSKTHDRFVRNFKKLSDHTAVLEQDLKSLADKHVRIHRDLVDRIRPLLGVLSVYAADSGNKALGKQVDVRAKQLGDLKDPRLLKLSEAVISLNAADYGLTGDLTDNIRTTSEELRSSRTDMKTAKKERKRSIEAARSLIKRNDNLLKTRMDKFIMLFRKSNEDFYNDYRQARRAESPRKKATAGPEAAEPES